MINKAPICPKCETRTHYEAWNEWHCSNCGFWWHDNQCPHCRKYLPRIFSKEEMAVFDAEEDELNEKAES